MKITVSQFAGFCFGAQRAYKIALEETPKSQNLYIKGDLLHNNEVIQKTRKAGIKKIKDVSQIKKGTLIITAHGDGKKVFDSAFKKGIKIINTTCPKVIRVQKLAEKFYKEGRSLIIIGDKNHKEVKGINGWCENKAIIISSDSDLEKLNPRHLKNPVVLGQTTQNLDNFLKMAQKLKKKIKSVKIFNTVCKTTKNRQEEAKELARNHEAVIVIGGKNSSNSRRLFEIASQINPKTFFVENEKEINWKEIKKLKSIGITAGASTPQWIIKKIYQKLIHLTTPAK